MITASENKNPSRPKGWGIFNVSDTPSDNGELMQNNPTTASSGVSETNKNTEINSKIKGIIKELKQVDEIDDEQLISSNFLDSFDIIRLVSELEKKFSITINGDEVIIDNFDSTESITKMIERITGR